MSIHSPSEQAIFEAARQLPPGEEREAYLREACGEDSAFEQRIRTLLAAIENNGSFLETPVVQPSLTTLASGREVSPMIGPYKLLEQIGEGGMGAVYLAEQQQPVQRKVALKIIKPGMDSRQIIARFEAERQALAMMDHPHIAKVLDGGTTEQGQPYFVMELVKGVPITQYCDEQHYTLKERLELFVPVCQAIQHAHQKGIIHRDLKPSNVLVTEYDERPVSKIIDFGVAKAMGVQLTEKTVFTTLGQLVGTLEYMSPEQAKLNQLDIDTRSDIYSLGVLLYELLTGSTPFDRRTFEQAAFDEILRIIREQEPPRPSLKLSSSDSLPSVAVNRNIEQARLSRQVRGELDWIVMRCLEKDRNRRYETANGLADDIKRYLSDEPVQACPPSKIYRLDKFVRRNLVALSFVFLLFTMVMATIGGVAWVLRGKAEERQNRLQETQSRQAKVAGQLEAVLVEVARKRAQGQWHEALVEARRAVPALATGDVDADTDRTVRSVLADLEFVEKLEMIRAEHGSVWGDRSSNTIQADKRYKEAFLELGIDVDADHLEDVVKKLRARRDIAPAVVPALDDWIAVRGQNGQREGQKVLITIAQEADADPWRRKLRDAILTRNWDALGKMAESPEIGTQPPATLYCLASILRVFGRDDASIKTLKLAQWRYPGDYWVNHRLGVSLIWTKEPAKVREGIGYMQAAVALRPDDHHPLMNLGNGYKNLNHDEMALACYEKGLAISPQNWVIHDNMAEVLARNRRYAEAILSYAIATRHTPDWEMFGKYALLRANCPNRELRDSRMALRIALEGTAKWPDKWQLWVAAGVAHYRAGDFVESVAAFELAAEKRGDPEFGEHDFFLAMAHAELGNAEAAEASFERAADWTSSNAKDDMEVLDLYVEAAEKLGVRVPAWVTGDVRGLAFVNHQEEEVPNDQAVVQFLRLLDSLPQDVAWHSEYARLCADLAQFDSVFEQVLRQRANHPGLWIGRGRALARQQKWPEAREAFEQVIRSRPLDDEQYEYACVLLLAEDYHAYQQYCHELSKRLTDTSTPHERFVVLRSCLMSLRSNIPAETLIDWGNTIVHADRFGWYLHALSLAYYRAGQYDAAIEWAEQSLAAEHWQPVPNQTQNHYVLALSMLAKGLPRSEVRRHFMHAFALLNGQHHSLGAPDFLSSYCLGIEAQQFSANQSESDQSPAYYVRRLDSLPQDSYVNSPCALLCFEIAQFDSAFQEVVRQRPNHPVLWIARGRILARRANWPEARTAYQRVIKSRPLDDEQFEYACVLLLADDHHAYQQHCQELRTRLTESSTPDERYVVLRACLKSPQSNIPAETLVEWGETIVLADRFGWYLHALSMAYYRAGRYEAAIELAEQSLAAEWPSNVKETLNHTILGMAKYSQGGSREDVGRHFTLMAEALSRQGGEGYLVTPDLLAYLCVGKEARELGGHQPAPEESSPESQELKLQITAQLKLAEAYRAGQAHDKAIAKYNEVLRLDPNHRQAGRELANLLLRARDKALRDPARAVELATQAIEASPQDPWGWKTLGQAQYLLGEFGPAIEALEKSCELQGNPEKGDALQWLSLAMAHWRLGNKDKADEWYQRGLDWTDIHKEQNSVAVELLLEAAETLNKPVPGWARKAQASFLVLHKQWDEVVAIYQRAIENTEEDRRGYSERSKVYQQLSQWDQVFERMAELRPDDVELRINRGRILARKSKFQKAKDAYAEGIQDYPISGACVEYACVLLLTGDQEGYRRYCLGLIERLRESSTIHERYIVLKACALSENPVVPPAMLIEWGEKFIRTQSLPWHHHARSLAFYRGGKHDLAIEQALETPYSLPWDDYRKIQNLLVLAMAYHAQDREVESQRNLMEAKNRWIKPESQWIGDEYVLTCRVLFKEAEAKLAEQPDSSETQITPN